MKIKHFFGLAVLAAMTASCSSNNDLVGGVMVQVRLRMVLRMLHSRLICLQRAALVLQVILKVHLILMKVLLQSMRLRMVLSLYSMLLLVCLLQVLSLET